jgi:hypothetical protein
MRELVIVKPARQLSLFEVGSNVLVGHLLKTGLDKICLLNLVLAADTSQLRLASSHLLITPSTSTAGRRSLAALCDAVVVAVHGIPRGDIRRSGLSYLLRRHA